MLVETDFLFGLSVKDPLHPHVIKLLERSAKGEFTLIISAVSPLEVALTLVSKGVSLGRAIQVLKLMEEALARYEAWEYGSLSLGVVTLSLGLRLKHRLLTLFDSIHLATAKNLDIPLVTSDGVLLRVARLEGVEAYDLRGF